jgi:hypothetical protein
VPSDAPDWEDILVEPFVGLILGQRGGGKTALGHQLLEVFGEGRDRDAYILGFPDHLRDELPEWIEVLPPSTGRENWPENSVVLIHEAHQLLHARRSMDGANIEIDELVTVSRHRDSDIIFETQQSQRLDRNAVTSVDAIIFREPALMQADFERSGMKKIVRAADDYFEQFVDTVESDDYTFREKSDEAKKHAYVHSGRFVGGYPHEIGLADHWSEDISKAYAEVSDADTGAAGLGEDKQVALDAVAAWEAENRPLDYDHKGANHNDVPIERAWTELQAVHSKGYLKKTYDSNNNPNEYRLTDDGWEETNVDEPDADELSSKAREN